MAGRSRAPSPGGSDTAPGVQKRLAQSARVSRVTLGSVERGDHPAGVLTYVRLERALGVSLDELLADAPMSREAKDQEAEAAFLRRLGKRARLLRLVRELTQDELAQATGMSRSFVSLIEKGSHGVDVVRLLRLADALDVSLLELLDLDSPQADRMEGLPS